MQSQYVGFMIHGRIVPEPFAEAHLWYPLVTFNLVLEHDTWNYPFHFRQSLGYSVKTLELNNTF